MKTVRFYILAILGILISPLAQADRTGYGAIVDISAETEAIRANHHHDWSAATRDVRWRMISTNKDPFTAENGYSVLTAEEKATKKVLFRLPVPALTYLWVSPDSKYVVGISNVKYWNPYQVVVFSNTGNCLLALDLAEKGYSESVTNWIHWYKEPQPMISVTENGDTAILTVEGAAPDGTPQRFEFPTAERENRK